MKHTKNLSLLTILVLGFILPSFAQELPEVTVYSYRYKYLNAVDNKEVAQPVKMLEHRAATYDVKNSEYYEDEYDNYFISFYIPDGEILATYDKEGKLLRTAEKFKNVAMPQTVAEAVAKRFPQWHISKDVYLVSYFDEKGATKTYKIILENGDKRLRVKTNEKGEFL